MILTNGSWYSAGPTRTSPCTDSNEPRHARTCVCRGTGALTYTRV